MSLGRILTIVANVFREVIRDRVLYLVGLFAIAMLASVVLLPQVAVSAEHKMTLDIGLAVMEILALVVAVFVGTGLINKEIEKRTVLVLMAKPMSRAEFIIGKHIGLSVVLAVMIVGMSIIYAATLYFSQTPYVNLVVSIPIAILYLILKLSLITAVAITFGVFTSPLLATLLTFAIYLMGSASRDIVTLGKLTQNPAIERVTNNLYLILPDLSRLDLKNQAVYGQLPPTQTLLENAGYGLLYIVLLLAISTLIFSQREF